MAASRGLSCFRVCHALSYLIAAAFARVWSYPYPGAGTSDVFRFDRSNPYFSSARNASSFFTDLMVQDEAEADSGADIQEKLVVRGQVVILECLERDKKQHRVKLKIKDTHSDAAVRWLHDDEEVVPDLRVTWSVEGRLRISHAVSKDSGVWQCRKDGYFRRPLRLIVTIPPERPFLVFGGAQLADGARLTTRAGNDLNLHCLVNGGNPAPSVAWFLNEREITANSSIRSEWRGPEDQFASVSNVTIGVPKALQNASVVCRVVHPALSRPHTSHLKLNIEYSPDFRLRRWPVWGSPLREGSAVSFLCSVEANPPSPPVWMKRTGTEEEEVASSSEGWLNFTRVEFHHRGWYKCATNHRFGHFSSNSVFINVLPSLSSTKSSGDDARVGASRLGASPSEINQPEIDNYDAVGRDPCTSQSGSSSLCWNAVSSSQDDESIDPIPEDRVNVRPEVTGPANCPPLKENGDSAENFIWRADIKIKVMNRTHAAYEGGPAMLTAHVCGGLVSSDQITWFPPSKTTPLIPGKSYRRWTAFNLSSPDSQHCVLSNLHIVPVLGSTDAGEWVILVVRALQAHAAVVQLNVSTPAKSLAAAKSDISGAVTPKPRTAFLSPLLPLLLIELTASLEF